MNRFENKAVIITGAAGGIGEATTRRIVSEGGKVVIADHSKEKAEQLAAELTQSGADVRPIYFSATELQSCKELIDFAMKEYGQVDILINNVGGTDPKRDLGIEELDINYFDEVFHLNLCCTMYLSQQVIPIMVAHGGGNIHARHAHDHVAPLGLGQQSLEIVRKLFGLGGGLVHFPVSGNDGFAISAIHGKCSPKYIKCFLKTLLIQQAGDARQHPPWGCP